jgi:NAD(P)H-hydrate epimerase
VLEAVKRPLPEDGAGRISPRAFDAILEASERADAVALGSGLGRSEAMRELVRGLLEAITVPVVVDADALYGLEPFERAGVTVLTPHSGELAALLDVDVAELDAHRLTSVRRAASLYGAVVLAKGADTLIAAPREGVLVAGYGRPSLATAGSGDVLSGVVAAFLAKGLPPRHAAGAAAVAHGIASGLVSPQRGMIASDLPLGIARALTGEGAVEWPPGFTPMQGAVGA